jgi:hypothetical protein
VQPKGERPPNKTKGIQGKRLGLPWIPLADSGLFNELQRKKIKNLALPRVAFEVVFGLLSADLRDLENEPAEDGEGERP